MLWLFMKLVLRVFRSCWKLLKVFENQWLERPYRLRVAIEYLKAIEYCEFKENGSSLLLKIKIMPSGRHRWHSSLHLPFSTLSLGESATCQSQIFLLYLGFLNSFRVSIKCSEFLKLVLSSQHGRFFKILHSKNWFLNPNMNINTFDCPAEKCTVLC